MENQVDEKDIKKLRNLIEEVNIAMLVTKHEDHLHSRPMATSDIDNEGNIWFFTNEFSGKIDQLEHDPHVSVSYSNPAKNTYIAIRGTAGLVTDKAKLEELYTPVIKAWFPNGLDDPKLALLKVKTEQAEYWDSSSSKMVTVFNILKAVVTGEKYDAGDHGKINLR
jgi:general stress protein 26